MIAKVITGKTFRGVLNYCLHDKEQLSLEEKQLLEKLDGLRHLQRAEVLDFNMCCGDKKELLRQFNDVRNLRPQLSKPVLHITLSFDYTDKTDSQKLRDIARDFARQYGFEKNQYVTVLHHDTQHKHLHIIANRIDFDGKTLNDSHSYKRAAEICRALELKYDLKQVLSPRRYLTQKERMVPRHDQRKEWMKQQVRSALLHAKDFAHFKELLQRERIEVIKQRGIAFQDNKKMYVKGSEVGYSLTKIEKVLQQSLQQRQEINKQLNQELSRDEDHHRQRRRVSLVR
jgi:hypothetical protein